MFMRQWLISFFALCTAAVYAANPTLNQLDFKIVPVVFSEKDIPAQSATDYQAINIQIAENEMDTTQYYPMWVSKKKWLTQKDYGITHTEIALDSLQRFVLRTCIHKNDKISL